MSTSIMLKGRGDIDCTDYHVGKQRRKSFRKSLDPGNDVVFADLLFPGVHNGSQFTSVLVVKGVFSRFVNIYMLKSKNERVVNQTMQHRLRQWDIEDTGKVSTDKGTEFCNKTIERWYKEKGIVHNKVRPKTSQLNMVERTHQTLIGIVKPMMHKSGLLKSFGVHALVTAVYTKNRVFCNGTGRTSYELMYGSKLDIHHIRTFELLA
ncbi:Integrase, catalytic core protein [Phytophthora megakarya]|uniref:Integrase, catalytic core protein n=1 Tax=Phytophthora megakarya TaxID=4795 RepID=A0A225VAA1_9STRA|nr:Integrase, catalytic core protein [Phytophthora megakarya]